MNSIPADLLLPFPLSFQSISLLSVGPDESYCDSTSQIHVVTIKGVSEVNLGALCVSCHTLWLKPWLIFRAAAITAGLHLIFGSPTSVSVCLWSACDVVRWIRWRGEMSYTWRLKALCVYVCVCVSSVVVVSVSWWRLDISGVQSLHQASLCCFYSASTAAGSQCSSKSNS